LVREGKVEGQEREKGREQDRVFGQPCSFPKYHGRLAPEIYVKGQKWTDLSATRKPELLKLG